MKAVGQSASPRWCGARCPGHLRAPRWQTAPSRRCAPPPPAWPAGRSALEARGGGEGRACSSRLFCRSRGDARCGRVRAGCPAMSLSLRAMPALSSATRSRYFWWLRASSPRFSGSPLLYSLEQFGLAGLGLPEFGLQDAAGIGIARALLTARPRGRRTAARWQRDRRRAARRAACGWLGALHDRDVAAFDELAVRALWLGWRVGVFVAAAVDAVLRKAGSAACNRPASTGTVNRGVS